MKMNGDQLMGILRAVIPGVVALLTHYGFGTDAQDTVALTAIATGVVAAWSYYTNKPGTVIPVGRLNP
jgi:hypothetical protein